MTMTRRPIILETLIMRYRLKGKARTRPDFFRVVLGPCAQFYQCEASEHGGGGGVQAYNFGNFNYEIPIEGEGQDTSRIF